MQASILQPYTASDGENIALQDWLLDDQTPRRGLVLIVHGLGEHAARYDALARQLCAWGFAVRAYDHYGHGQSTGVRGRLPSTERLLDDLLDVLASTRRRLAPRVPLILLGHSLGGLLAAHALTRDPSCADALILSSPALELRLQAWQRGLQKLLWHIAPDLCLPNGVRAKYLSHDPQVVQDYERDPLVHHRISARLLQYLLRAGEEVIHHASQWSTPSLVLYAGRDHLVQARGSVAFARTAPPALVQSHGYASMYHEIFNEVGRQAVLQDLSQWLDHWFVR
jgi:alpha-beta hydrolase superfamily lysophospholipase